MEKKIAITGSSGFIGNETTIFLKNQGYTVENLNREIVRNGIKLQFLVNATDVVINLAGSSILTRWNRKNKKHILSSRIKTTQQIAQAIRNSQTPPGLFISASAIGLYDNIHEHTEYSNKIKNDFLAEIVYNWEKEALVAKSEKTRVVLLRFGVVLGRSGGIIKKMTPFVKFGIGATIGSGKQAFSYIHVKDVVRAISYMIENKHCTGIYNATNPKPVTNEIFTKALGKKMHRPIFFNIPEWIIRQLLKNGGSVLTDGQKALPKKLIDDGFIFAYPSLNECLNDIFAKQVKS